MALLTDLPVEILREIISHVRDTRVALALTKTCRHLHDLSQRRLYGLGWLGALRSAVNTGNLDVLRQVKRFKSDRISFMMLAYACKHPYVDIVAELLEEQRLFDELVSFYSKDPAASTFQGTCPLYNACKSGSADIVELLLKTAGSSASRHRGPRGETPLHGAAAGGHEDIVSLLLSAGAEVNAQQNDGSMPLHSALRHGHYTAMKVLLENGADVHAGNREHAPGSPLHEALSRKFHGISKLLIQYGANVSELAGVTTPLYAAVVTNQLDMAELLIQKGADVNAEQVDGSSALQIAVKSHLLHACRFLLDKGASLGADSDARADLIRLAAATDVEVLKLIFPAVKAQEQSWGPSYSCLLHACRSPEALQFLLESGVTATEDPDAAGDTALFALLRCASDRSRGTHLRGIEKCTKLLLDYGANPSAKSITGTSLLEHTINKGLSCAVAKMLLDSGAHTSISSVISRLSRRGCKHSSQVVQSLIDGGASIDEADKWAQSAVAEACEQRNLGMLQVLLENGASPIGCQLGQRCNLIDVVLGLSFSAKPSAGEAAEMCIQALLEAGVSPNEAVGGSITPLQKAVIRKNENVVDTLLQHGGDPNSYLRFASTNLLFPLLHGAILFGAELSMAELLVKHGASIGACDTNGLSILDWALALGRSEEFRDGLLALSPDTAPMSFRSDNTWHDIEGSHYSLLFKHDVRRRNATLGSLEFSPTPTHLG